MNASDINFSEIFFAVGWLLIIFIAGTVAVLALLSSLVPKPSVRQLATRKGVWRILLRLSLLVALLFILGILSGCAGDPAKPRTEAEEFPVDCGKPAQGVVREKGSIGLILMTGTAPSQVCIFDQAGRFVEQWSLRGANRFILSPSGQPYRLGIEKRLDPGCYRMDIYSFQKDISLLRGEQLFILPKQSANICAGNATAFNIPIWGSTTGGFYSWKLELTANIQPMGSYATPYSVPLFQINSPIH